MSVSIGWRESLTSFVPMLMGFVSSFRPKQYSMQSSALLEIISPESSMRTFIGSNVRNVSEKGCGFPMILLVEDNPEMAGIIRKALEATGLRVVWAPTSDAALEALATESCELAIVDMVLAGSSLNGIEFFYKARATGYDVPMISITGAKGLFPDSDMPPTPFSAVLGKPFLITELRALVDQYARPRLEGKQ